jgi:hypothetical protein
MGELLRFNRLRDHIEEFIAHDLGYILEDLKDYGIITSFCYTSKLTYDFARGVDFYLVLEKKEIGIQLTDNEETAFNFANQGIVTIFLPERDAKGELLFPEERRKMVLKSLQKILSQFGRFH